MKIAREIYDKSVFAINHGEINSFIEALEWSLYYLQMPSKEIIYSAGNEVKISSFDGAILLSGPGLDGRGDSFSFINPFENPDVTDYDLIGEMNVKSIVLPSEKGAAISLRRFRDVELPTHLKNYKHRFKKMPIIEHSFAVLTDSEKWFTAKENFVVVKNLKSGFSGISPVCLEKGYDLSLHPTEEYFKSDYFKETYSAYLMSMSVNFSSYYEWWAYFRDTNGIGIKIPILPETLKDIDSSIPPEDGSRKKAFLHFVKSHYRTISNKYDEEYRNTLVKSHYRGRTKINYRGLELHIIPSKYDLNRIKPGKKFLNR